MSPSHEFDDGKDIVAAIGGGHGLAVSLQALVIAGVVPVGIVSVADDGGSSGRLREEFGLIPPGDIRKCLVALAEDGSTWSSAFKFRFESGELAGHSLGNLIIAGLTAITGDFGKAITLVEELLQIRGRLYPSSSTAVVLGANVGRLNIEGQVQVMNTAGIKDVFTIPLDPEVPEGAIEAIMNAKTVLVGPGSLYTSVLAVLCIPKIKAALKKSSAKKVYIANLRPQVAETTGFDIADHIRALLRHDFVPDVVLADTSNIELGNAKELCVSVGANLVICDLADSNGHTHNPELLGKAFQEFV